MANLINVEQSTVVKLKYTVELSQEEIYTLYCLLTRVGGSDSNSLRRYATRILNAIRIDLPYPCEEVFMNEEELKRVRATGSINNIYFADGSINYVPNPESSSR
jgi:hypothetical protein